jgi:hypothetical protein
MCCNRFDKLVARGRDAKESVPPIKHVYTFQIPGLLEQIP